MVWTLLFERYDVIVAVKKLHKQEGLMKNITTIGLDLAKRVFQVHGMDHEGRAVLCKKLRRGQVLKFFATLSPCLVGMEACGSAHHWARELRAQGHEVRLIPPQYVRPFLKTNKHDAADAEAIAEALVRPTMRFAPIKSADQQAVLMVHRSRELLVKQRTMLINAVRGHCSELGMIASQGASKVNDLMVMIEDPDDVRLPAFAREALGVLITQLRAVKEAIRKLESKLQAWHRSQQASQRLTTIPGVGVITATALIATIGDGSQFNSGRHLSAWLGLVPRQHSSGSGRHLSAWLGLVPRQHSSGGKSRLGRISKRGDGYVRRLLVHGSRAVLRWQRAAPKKPSPWIGELLTRRPTNVVLVAMANKTARTVWAMMRDRQDFNTVFR
jgi:transposase